MYKLYWIHSKNMTDPYSEGYVGITGRSVDSRLNAHITRHENITEKCEIIVLSKGTKDQISKLEKQYRPTSWIGWNKSPGGLTGGRPTGIHTSGWTHSEEARNARSERSKGSGNPMYGKTQSEKQKKAVGSSARERFKGKKKNYKVVNPVMKGADNPKARKIYVEGVIYDTITACKEAYGMKNHNSIRYRLNSTKTKWKDWYYLD